MQYRQGDVLIESVTAIPLEARRLKRLILATGDATGQRHQIRDRASARMFATGTSFRLDLFLEVTAAEATIVHPEHGPITLPTGFYRVWRQREFTGFGTQFVRD